MRYGETGYDLEIDLTRGSVERVETDPRLTALHLGGLGTNTRTLWDRVSPETGPFSPDNLLIFAAGLLAGTPVVGANRTIVSTISPQTLLMAFSMMGGFFGPELKHAGYDRIIFRGKSPRLVYIWIHDDKVEIRDASHLRGKGAVETEGLIREELNDQKIQVAAIGLAGENRVFMASIEHNRASASRLGTGAVMGDKGIKAIAVRGTKDINVARPAELMKLCNESLAYIKQREANPVKEVMPILQGLGSPQEMKHVDEEWHSTSFSWGNARVRRKDYWTEQTAEQWRKTHEEVRKRLISCYNCPVKCGAVISVPGLSTYLMKCFTKMSYTMAAFSDLDFGFRIAQRATEYAVDGLSTPQTMAFAVELYEAGILTDDDFAGCPPDKEGRFYWLLEKIVRREGIGNVLADGTYWAAKAIGKGAEAYAHNNTKKHEQQPVKLGMLNPMYFLMYATGEKMNLTQIEGQFPQGPFNTVEAREEFVKDWYQVPDERFKEYFLKWEPRGENSFPHYPNVEMAVDIVDWQEKMHYIDDCVGMCAGLSSFVLKPVYHMHNYPAFISAATGIDLDEDGLTEIFNRNRQLLRAFNVRRGMRRVDDKPPEDQWKHRFPELEERLLNAYYAFRGWDNDGIPTRESLHSLSLDYVAEDLEKRGIIAAESVGIK